MLLFSCTDLFPLEGMCTFQNVDSSAAQWPKHSGLCGIYPCTLIVILPSNCGCGDFSAISYRYMVAALEVLVGWTQEESLGAAMAQET
jgi:hypothetical protein